MTDKKLWLDGKPDAILVSAGGDDIAGEQFWTFLDNKPGCKTCPTPGLNEERFKKLLGKVEANYLTLFDLRDRHAPEVPIISHCYDFAIPDGRGVVFWGMLIAGPWLKPSLDLRGWTELADGKRIVWEALRRFKEMLQGLARNPHNNFHVVDTQGTLKDNEWANELHPTPDGFEQIAELMSKKLIEIVKPKQYMMIRTLETMDASPLPETALLTETKVLTETTVLTETASVEKAADGRKRLRSSSPEVGRKRASKEALIAPASRRG